MGYWLIIGILLVNKGASGFMYNTLLTPQQDMFMVIINLAYVCYAFLGLFKLERAYYSFWVTGFLYPVFCSHNDIFVDNTGLQHF